MAIKNIELITPPVELHWVGNGFRVHNFIPAVEGVSMERMNPFVLLDYNAKHYFPPSTQARGVGVHPHRGIETVSIAYKGRIAHHDSNGGGGVIGEGDVQWMTAASGILHKEYHEKEFCSQGGEFHMVQLWTNLPAKDKKAKPKYQAITNENMGKSILPDNAGIIEVISGEYFGTKGPAETFTPINLMNAKLNSGGKANFSFPANYNTALLVIEGSIRLNENNEIPTNNFVLFGVTGEDFTIEAKENSIILIMSAEPLNEPIAAAGPFVMNTRQEILEAYEDYSQGKFGHLED
jgi:hypothetical protein